MWILDLVRQLNPTPKRTRGRRTRAVRPSLARSRLPVRLLPCVERLERRVVPSTLTVTSALDDGSTGTLRAVLAAAQRGDTIEFADQLAGQTVTLSAGQLDVNQDLFIDGPGAGVLAISGDATGRIFAVGAGATVTISGLSLTQGLATDGAAVLNAGNLTLSQDVLDQNVSQGVAGGGLFGDDGGRGGAVENQAGASLTVVDTEFAGNEALGGPDGGNALGGAIYNQAGAVTINQSTFTDNQAIAGNGGTGGVAATLSGGISVSLLGLGAGGAIWNDGGLVAVAGGLLSDNQARGGSGGDASGSTARFVLVGTGIGGAVGSGAFFTTAAPNLTLAGSTLNGNRAQGGSDVVVGVLFGVDPGHGCGGALGAVAGDVSVSASTVSNNLAAGGTMFTVIRNASPVEALASGALGGGIDDEFALGFSATFPATAAAALQVTNSTIRDNIASGDGPNGPAAGGGLATQRVNVQMTGSTISDNQALGGAGGGFFTSGRTVQPGSGGSVQGGGIASFSGSLTVTGSDLNDNLAQGGLGGTPGNGSGFGGDSTGGGIDFSGPSFAMTGCTLGRNQAISGDATPGNGFFSVTGSNASRGGAILVNAASATIRESTFVKNLTRGGVGLGAFGGSATGGAATLSGGTLQMSGCAFVGNEAAGGAGGEAAAGARGGNATAGALETTTKNTSVSDTSFVQNLAQGGVGGSADSDGKTGGGGGAGGGGAFISQPANSSAAITTTLANCDFVHNVAAGGTGGAGGAGAAGGAGGNGFGGAALNSLVTFVLPELSVRGCDFVGNLAEGGAGGAGAPGGSANGGAVSEIADLTMADSSFIGNEALGGPGGARTIGTAGGGGTSLGGGLSIGFGSTATVGNSRFVRNTSQGGAGGPGAGGVTGGAGGAGEGGALANVLSTTDVNSCSFLRDVAAGGAGGSADAVGGSGGNGLGGAVYNALVNGFGQFSEVAALTIGQSTIAQEQAVGGAGGSAAVGGHGGDGEGGGFFESLNGFAGSATLSVSASAVRASAANGGTGATGGNGFGGGIFLDTGATATALSSEILNNQADGGIAAPGGVDGQGVGGGVYNLGAFFLDASSMIADNHASSSNDDVFGPVTPI